MKAIPGYTTFNNTMVETWNVVNITSNYVESIFKALYKPNREHLLNLSILKEATCFSY